MFLKSIEKNQISCSEEQAGVSISYSIYLKKEIDFFFFFVKIN
jgi:hypothetical protein